MTKRFFHVYADRKTIREIPETEYHRLTQSTASMAAWLDEEGIVFVKLENVIHIPFQQLTQILDANKKPTEASQ